MEGFGATLKAKLKANVIQLPEMSRVRIHRAISWLSRAEAEDDDLDARFLFLWISFNAAYAHEFGFESSERQLLEQFLSQLNAVDQGGRLHKVLFDRYSGPVRTLIDNRFVFEPFWRALRDHDSSGTWEQKFQASQRAALKAVFSNDTPTVLGIVFDRLYVLRNQLVHGGATWNSRVNRAQMKDGAHLLHALVPVMIDVMLDNPALDYGNIAFPVV